jgi:hypothetical protein
MSGDSGEQPWVRLPRYDPSTAFGQYMNMAVPSEDPFPSFVTIPDGYSLHIERSDGQWHLILQNNFGSPVISRVNKDFMTALKELDERLRAKPGMPVR